MREREKEREKEKDICRKSESIQNRGEYPAPAMTYICNICRSFFYLPPMASLTYTQSFKFKENREEEKNRRKSLKKAIKSVGTVFSRGDLC